MSKKSYLVIFFAAAFIIRFFLSLKTFNRDIFNYIIWTESILKQGLSGFYERNFSPWAAANYPPLANLFFLVSHKLYLLFNFRGNNNLLASFYKLPLLMADVVIVFYLYKIGSKKSFKEGIYFMLLFLLNLGLFYNSVFWGQLESLMTMFCLLSLIFFYRQKKILGIIFYTLALLTKQSAVFFLPIFLILFIKQTNYREKIIGLGLIYFISAFLFSLFTDKFSIIKPITFYFKILGGQPHQHLASVNAFNWWFLLSKNQISDQIIFLGINYQHYSFLMVFLFSIPVLWLCFLKPKEKRLWYAASLLGFIGFLFLTRMHERHLYPALVFLIPFIDSTKRFIFYIMVSLIYFFNQFFVWQELMAKPTLTTINLGKFFSLLTIVIFLYYYFTYFNGIAKKQL